MPPLLFLGSQSTYIVGVRVSPHKGTLCTRRITEALFDSVESPTVALECLFFHKCHLVLMTETLQNRTASPLLLSKPRLFVSLIEASAMEIKCVTANAIHVNYRQLCICIIFVPFSWELTLGRQKSRCKSALELAKCKWFIYEYFNELERSWRWIQWNILRPL